VNDDLRAAIGRIEWLKNNGALQPVWRMGTGNGPYGLRAVFADGTSHVKAYGFDTPEDADLFRTFIQGLPREYQPETIQTPFGIFTREQQAASAVRHDIIRVVMHVDVTVIDR
jgi:hypothetical protein